MEGFSQATGEGVGPHKHIGAPRPADAPREAPSADPPPAVEVLGRLGARARRPVDRPAVRRVALEVALTEVARADVAERGGPLVVPSFADVVLLADVDRRTGSQVELDRAAVVRPRVVTALTPRPAVPVGPTSARLVWGLSGGEL